MIEVNACANVITFLDMYKIAHPEHKDTPALVRLFEHLEEDAWHGIHYIKQLDNPKDIYWVEVNKIPWRDIRAKHFAQSFKPKENANAKAS